MLLRSWLRKTLQLFCDNFTVTTSYPKTLSVDLFEFKLYVFAYFQNFRSEDGLNDQAKNNLTFLFLLQNDQLLSLVLETF